LCRVPLRVCVRVCVCPEQEWGEKPRIVLNLN
jgi:hypothetical protein